MQIRPYSHSDQSDIIMLWRAAGLTVWYKDPIKDINRFVGSPSSAILIGELDGRLIGSVAVGFDGHRGWCDFVGVHQQYRGKDAGSKMMAAGEAWLLERGAPKCHLMVRPTNQQALGFYEALGYANRGTMVLERWIEPIPAALPEGASWPTGSLEHAKDNPRNIDTVVTYLEMLERPERSRSSPRARTTFSRVNNPSLAFYRFLYDTVGAPWAWWERRRLPDDQLAKIIRDRDVEVHVLSFEGQPVGFAELDRRTKPDVELEYFGLVPEFIGRGLGRWFLNHVVDLAWDYSPRRLWLHTCDLDHPRAVQVYREAGFVEYDKKQETIRDPRRLGYFEPRL